MGNCSSDRLLQEETARPTLPYLAVEQKSLQRTYASLNLAIQFMSDKVLFKYNGGNARNIALTADKGHFATAYPGITFNGSGPSPRQTSSHPHQVVEYGNEILIPDLVRLNP